MKNIKTKNLFQKILTLLVCISLMPALVSCGDDDENIKPADYGTYGADFALELAKSFPFRNAFSSGEQGAGLMIKNELEGMGYKVEAQSFSAPDGRVSYNYIVRIPGEGFMQRDSFGEYAEVKKTVVIGAHYDSPIEYAQRVDYPDYDGIQNNACGIGALMTIAKEMYGHTYGYDVILVAFGASSSNYLGAGVFLTNMTEEETKSIECMYCIESIYAGDKLYAHAGLSSLKEGKKYSYRRKLYEAYDVAYENSLLSKTGIDLNYNMSLLSFDVNGDNTIDMYREVTTVKSDYVTFDNNSIPIVFIESSDYNFSKMEDMKETKNLELQEFGGAIRNTPLDSSKILSESLDETRLQNRINVTSFIVVKAVEKGSQNCVPVSRYKEGERLEPTVSPKKKNEKDASASESRKNG
ncbi:MAG: M28 family peptidase [Clostridiales bacterium]|nr:M28 family peptidase [Clostridiales bacterium]